MARSLTLCFFLLIFAMASCSQAPEELRAVENNVLTSSATPKMQLSPSAEFTYAGSVRLTIKDVAHAERYHWVVTENGRVKKLVIAQFEGFFDEIDRQYNIRLPKRELTGSNYKFTPAPIMLGGQEFIHNTWAFDNGRSAQEDPDLESAATLNLLTERGYTLDDDLIMSRFARSIGDDRRNELILFYMEPLADHGKSLVDFPEDGAISEDYETLSDGVRARSLESFSVTFGN